MRTSQLETRFAGIEGSYGHNGADMTIARRRAPGASGGPNRCGYNDGAKTGTAGTGTARNFGPLDVLDDSRVATAYDFATCYPSSSGAPTLALSSPGGSDRRWPT